MDRWVNRNKIILLCGTSWRHPVLGQGTSLSMTCLIDYYWCEIPPNVGDPHRRIRADWYFWPTFFPLGQVTTNSKMREKIGSVTWSHSSVGLQVPSNVQCTVAVFIHATCEAREELSSLSKPLASHAPSPQINTGNEGAELQQSADAECLSALQVTVSDGDGEPAGLDREWWRGTNSLSPFPWSCNASFFATLLHNSHEWKRFAENHPQFKHIFSSPLLLGTPGVVVLRILQKEGAVSRTFTNTLHLPLKEMRSISLHLHLLPTKIK